MPIAAAALREGASRTTPAGRQPLSPPRSPAPHRSPSVAARRSATLHESFDYYLAVVQRLDADGVAARRRRGGPAGRGGRRLPRPRAAGRGRRQRARRPQRPRRRWSTTPACDSDYLRRNPAPTPARSSRCRSSSPSTNWGVLNLEQRERGAFDEEDLLLAHVVAGQIGAAIHRCQLVGELEDAFLTTIGVISDAVEMQDSYTANHANEVADLAVRGRRTDGDRRASSSTASATAPCSTTSARSACPARSCASPAR